jgi:carboxymethylenebutenolidase
MRNATLRHLLGAMSVLSVVACAHSPRAADEHAGHGADATTVSAVANSTTITPVALPADAGSALQRLNQSPRHGEWVTVRNGDTDSVRAWVVYPERSSKAPVVVVVHEIFGMQNWVRAVGDQLAAEGFIAIVPDLLTGKDVGAVADTANRQMAMSAIQSLDPTITQQRIAAVARYGMSLPAALPKYGVVGFCWGGSTTFAHAVFAPTLGAAVVYYGSAPQPLTQLASVRAPVLGLYGGNDARIGATVPPTDSAMKALGKTYEPHTFPGAGHGFLRQQVDSTGANLAASKQAWPLTIAWLRKYLGA